jgi:hypothetical protein
MDAMKELRLIVAAALAGWASAAMAGAEAGDLGWMAGSWIETRGERVVRETWLPPTGGIMAGVSASVRPGRTTELEFMKIGREAGRLTYTAMLEGQPPTPFVLVSARTGEAVFENLAHDFPQRIIYRRCGKELCARIEGQMAGVLQAQDWRYRRERR